MPCLRPTFRDCKAHTPLPCLHLLPSKSKSPQHLPLLPGKLPRNRCRRCQPPVPIRPHSLALHTPALPPLATKQSRRGRERRDPTRRLVGHPFRTGTRHHRRGVCRGLRQPTLPSLAAGARSVAGFRQHHRPRHPDERQTGKLRPRHHRRGLCPALLRRLRLGADHLHQRLPVQRAHVLPRRLHLQPPRRRGRVIAFPVQDPRIHH